MKFNRPFLFVVKREMASRSVHVKVSKAVIRVAADVVILIALKAHFIRRISVPSNAIQTKDNETAYLIINCLNCIRRDENSTYKTGLL